VEQVVVNADGTDWLTPAATLLAVLIGGALSVLGQHLLTRSRQNGEAKAAARVIQGDLGMVASRLKDMAVDDPRWFAFEDLRLAHWTESQGALALELDSADWEAVQQSALECRWITEKMEIAFAPGGPLEGQNATPLDEEFMASVKKGWMNATNAYNALAQLAKSERVRGLLHEDLKPVSKGAA
jgi:hypothetical protein